MTQRRRGRTSLAYDAASERYPRSMSSTRASPSAQTLLLDLGFNPLQLIKNLRRGPVFA